MTPEYFWDIKYEYVFYLVQLSMCKSLIHGGIYIEIHAHTRVWTLKKSLTRIFAHVWLFVREVKSFINSGYYL